MSEGIEALQIVVVAVHAAGWDKRAADGFRYGVTEVVKRVEQRLKSKASSGRSADQVLKFRTSQ